jgi:hypothetical protein
VLVAAAASWRMFVAGMAVLMAVMMFFSRPATMLVRVPHMPMIVVVAGMLFDLLRLKRPRHLRNDAAQTPRHLGQRRIGLHVYGLACQLRRGMAPAELPGETQQTERVLGPDLEKALRRRPHLDEAAVLQLDGVTVVEDRRPVEIERKFEPAVAPDGGGTAAAGGMVKPGRISDTVLFDGGFADNAGGAEHDGGSWSYHEPVFAIETQGSCGALGWLFCKSSMEMPSGERMKAIWPSRGGRLMVTPASISLAQVA